MSETKRYLTFLIGTTARNDSISNQSDWCWLGSRLLKVNTCITPKWTPAVHTCMHDERNMWKANIPVVTFEKGNFSSRRLIPSIVICFIGSITHMNLSRDCLRLGMWDLAEVRHIFVKAPVLLSLVVRVVLFAFFVLYSSILRSCVEWKEMEFTTPAHKSGVRSWDEDRKRSHIPN